MLSTHYSPRRLRRAANLVPRKAGGLASRPGAQQIMAGAIEHARPWGNRLLAQQDGRLVLWDGDETDLGQAGVVLQATAFQALTQNAQREDRLYVADGINPLFYVARRNGAYGRTTVVNSVQDADGAPYALPIPQLVTTWRSRLWIGWGTNRLQHCQNEDPDYWDPLWTVEFQSGDPDSVNAAVPMGQSLLAGLGRALWSVTGDSHLNWRRDEVRRGPGTTGPQSMASDGQTAYWVSPKGLQALGATESLSDDVRELFNAPVYPGQAVIDTGREWLLTLANGRLLVMHLSRPGEFGEIMADGAHGLFAMQDYVGWYGHDGAWVLLGEDSPDVALDGARTDFESRYETWPDQPNLAGGGRAALDRAVVQALGSARGDLRYTLTVDGETAFTDTASLVDEAVDLWSDAPTDGAGEAWPPRVVRREFVPHADGAVFQHRLSADCHVEVLSFEPQYRFGGE